MERRITARAIVLHDGKLLCARLKPDERDAHKNTYWSTPGGGVNPGEPLCDAARREMLEETGVEPVVGPLRCIQQFIFNGREYLEFFFQVTNSEDYLHIDLSKTTHGELEIEEIGFVDPKTTHILPKFLAEEDLAEHMASSQGAKVFSYL